MSRNQMIAIGAGALTVGLLAGLWGYTQFAQSGSDDPFADCRTTAVAGGSGTIGGPFTLVDENGVTVTDQDLMSDTAALLYFGYTYCPDVCPLDSARNADAVYILEERGYDVLPLFVSVDPDRDTPEVLKEFTDYLHPRMIGLTGSPEQVDAASKAYRTYYRKHDDDPEYYLIDHSTFSYLTLPEHGFVEVFRRDLPAERMADQMACFLDAM